MSVRLLAFAASLRKASLNRKLLELAVETARQRGASVDLADFHDFDMPLYDGDLQEREGIPAGAQEFARRVQAADGLLLASPEYNYSIPGTLKNVIDWVSRIRPVPLKGKSALLLSTSTGLIGGNRGLWALRVPLESLGMYVYPDMFSLANGNKVLESPGGLTDPAAKQRLDTLIGAYLEHTRRISG